DGVRMYANILLFPDGNFYLGWHSNSVEILTKRKFLKAKKKWLERHHQYSNDPRELPFVPSGFHLGKPN
ncbi:MAG: hypothetical protein QNJ57_13725, partial [Flavobacteriaceae bacterium]|nr:hypothetical protein [Flavobacteriaceae bacterium]